MLSRLHLASVFLLVAAGALVACPASAQSPSAPAASAGTPPYPPQTYQPPPAPGYQPAVPPGTQPQPSQPAPGYQPSYQQPAYQQQQPGYQQPGYQQPPPGYQQPPNYQQPGYQQPGYPPPGYQQQPGYQPYPYQQTPYSQPYIPPPPVRTELKWSIRFNLFDLLFGRGTMEVEYAFAPPFSLTVAPQYIFADPRMDRDYNVTANGYGFYGELGVWVEGRPLRGYFLKGHAEHAEIKFHGDAADVSVTSTKLGIIFGSQSVYGGWFTLAGGFGIAVDTQSKEQSILGHDTRSGAAYNYTIPASGLFGNGWDLLSQIGLGGSF